MSRLLDYLYVDSLVTTSGHCSNYHTQTVFHYVLVRKATFSNYGRVDMSKRKIPFFFIGTVLQMVWCLSEQLQYYMRMVWVVSTLDSESFSCSGVFGAQSHRSKHNG